MALGMSVREASIILGVSTQRINQLIGLKKLEQDEKLSEEAGMKMLTVESVMKRKNNPKDKGGRKPTVKDNE